MYYTGIDPRDGSSVYVCKNPHEKAMQRALIQYRNPANYELVREALIKAGREDLIGYDKKCLIRPRRGESGFSQNTLKDGKDTAKNGRNIHKDKSKGGRPTQKTVQSPKQARNTVGSNKPPKKKTIRNVHRKKQP